MTRRVLLIVLIASVAFGQEIKRPTADADGGNNLTLGCHGQNTGSASMPLGYDAAGLATFSSTTVQGTQSRTYFSTRAFSSWQPPSNVYTSLSLNVNWSGTEVTTGLIGQMCVNYSTDGGATYTSMGCSNGGNQPQSTRTVSLSTSQNLATVKVAICVQGTQGGDSPGSKDTLNMYDIWTSGTVSGIPGAGNGSTAGQPHRDIVIVN